MQTVKENDSLFTNSINPLWEISAYEALWENETTSFKKLSELFRSQPGSKPSDFVSDDTIREFMVKIKNILNESPFNYSTNLIINGTFDYPNKLKDAKEPVEILYYTGNIDFLYTRSIAVVGTRNPSPEGVARASKLVKMLVKDNFTVVSGLATGIDTVAHRTAIAEGGWTIAVIGTPLDTVYPKENEDLQKQIASRHLLISQVPFYRYKQQSFRGNRLFFPERNKTMSALTEATVIVEAGETSGTLIQARAALHQGRKLFILNSCFENKSITWPARFEKQGAIRVKEYSDIINNL